MTVVGSSFGDVLVETDVSTVPAEPPDDIIYHHRVNYLESLKNLWAAREIIYTLAERDFRAQYKQATLGVLWAVLSPVATLLIFVVVFSRVKTFGSQGLPVRPLRLRGHPVLELLRHGPGDRWAVAALQQGPAGQDPVPSGVLPPGDPVRQRPRHAACRGSRWPCCS